MDKYISPLAVIECTRCNVRVLPSFPEIGSVVKVVCHVCDKSDKLKEK